eukprot:CAMPEP_0184490978 /NCGR_PEP_ID=MMETSP0113_2-20130426/19326_1 /TAXON_ID=91329 /ORGANISM="Norrisiella sphaerica, Strain BC52" /LENGTH=590 /DNA_ID=CAMNT_0026875137 /DNA_START=122 /DNA_END=1894 /DNA_ORIENTATION=+
MAPFLGSSLDTTKFMVPSLSFRSMNSETQIKNAIKQNGIVAITGIPHFEEAQLEAMNHLASCEAELPHLFKTSYLKDGTTRSTLAAETRSGVSMLFGPNIISGCPGFVAFSKRLRDITSQVSFNFIQSLDRNFGPLQMKRSGKPYTSLTEALGNAQQLDHFHVYKAPLPSLIEHQTMTVDFHTDDGLFIAISPALLLPRTEASSGSGVNQGRSLHASPGFYIKMTSGMEVEAMFPDPHCLVFMVGSGLARWVDGAQRTGIRNGVPHGVRIPAASTRLWFGRMFLPPKDALSLDTGMKFMDYRDLQLLDFYKEQSSLGCVQNVESERLPVAVQFSESAKCQEDEFHCWMRCWSQNELNETCTSSQHLECLSTSTGEACDPEKMGCMPQCVDEKDQAFCNRDTAVSMYMEGFVNPGGSKQACVILLFQDWVLDTKAKFIGACFGVIIMGVALEMLIFLRRRQRSPKFRKMIPNLVYVMIEGISYGLQTCLGYFLMLIAMTFSIPLFVCLIVGLALGHVIFNTSGPVAEGATPCCEATSLAVDPVNSSENAMDAKRRNIQTHNALDNVSYKDIKVYQQLGNGAVDNNASSCCE